MKIVHVVTYVSADGAFGGPIAVALGQLEELARQGHEVELLAGWDGKADLSAAGVEITLFKVRRLWKHGFSGLWAPGLARTVRARVRDGCSIHVHLARDLVTLPAALSASTLIKPILQTHGMIMPDMRIVARVLDRVLTVAVLRRAHRILALTPEEVEGIRAIAGTTAEVEIIANGVRIPSFSQPSRRDREVLFLARLHPRKRVLVFAEMCRLLVARGVEVRASVIGPDEGDLLPLMKFIREHSLEGCLKYEGVLQTGQSVSRLARAGVYVLPSTGEVFPMTVLESLAAGTPVVTTNSSGIAPHLLALNAAEVTGESPEELASSVERILGDHALRESLIDNGYLGLKTTFSIEKVVQRLVLLYQPKQ